MRVLIVEDDPALGKFLQKGLERDGHDVQLVTDGQMGLRFALDHRPDLMVLDLSLPGKDGLEVLAEMHGRFAETSVLVLTGRNGVEDRVKCLNLGADDCLVKPFSFTELMARCRALVRRREQFADPMLRVGTLELNRMQRTVTRDAQPVELTTKEFALLEYLMRARGKTCSRGDLLRDVWQTPAAGTNVVDVYVNYLRKKLGAVLGGSAEQAIETVRGEGYRMTQPEDKRPSRGMELELDGQRLTGLGTWTSEELASA
jgi:DNA-binding response OmpR family regulator